MKLILLFILLSSTTFAKSCYKDKSKDKIVCLYKYFDRTNIYKPQDIETYYITQNRSIYALSDKIEIKFNTIGAIISLEKDFEIDFFDKLKNETYIFKVRDKSELFSIITNLNSLDAIQKAVPSKKRKYTKTEIRIRAEKRKERQKKALLKSKNTQKKQIGFDQNFENTKSGAEPKNFLGGDV